MPDQWYFKGFHKAKDDGEHVWVFSSMFSLYFFPLLVNLSSENVSKLLLHAVVVFSALPLASIFLFFFSFFLYFFYN